MQEAFPELQLDPTLFHHNKFLRMYYGGGEIWGGGERNLEEEEKKAWKDTNGVRLGEIQIGISTFEFLNL